MTDDTPVVTGSAESDDGLGGGSRVEVRIFPPSDRSFNEVMNDVWRTVQGALHSAGLNWSDDSLDAWIEHKAQEIRAIKGEGF